MAKKIKAVAWTSTVYAATSSWFSADVSVGGGNPVRHIIQVAQASACAVDMVMTNNNTSPVTVTTVPLNGGADVSAALVQESFIVTPGTSYNIDHQAGTGTHKVYAIVVEDEDDITV